MYRDLSGSQYSRRSLTWLKTVSIGVCGSYCIALVLCSRSISWLGKIFPYGTSKYWMSTKRVPVNLPVVLLLVAVMYFASKSNTSCCMGARSTPLVSWKNNRFFSYWRFSSSWAWQVTAIGILSLPG